MTTLTIQVPKEVKRTAKQKTKQDGITLTFLIQQFLKAYNNGLYQPELRFTSAEEKHLKTLLENDETFGPFEDPAAMFDHIEAHEDSV